jgi:hypothetical protein
MFSFGRRDDQMSPHHNQQHLMSTKADKSAESKPFRTLLKQARKQPPNNNSRTRGGRSSDDAPLNIDEMNVNETKQGIEVSLDFFKTETREPPHTQRGEPVISIKEQIRQRQRVYRTQFSVSFPALQSSSHGDPDVTLDNWRPRDHQIPLPRKLYRRMNGEDDIGDLTYLSTGPHGCYYAEFRSGECWWGSAVEDHDFHAIIQACNLEEARGRQQAEGKAEFVIAGSSRCC